MFEIRKDSVLLHIIPCPAHVMAGESTGNAEMSAMAKAQRAANVAAKATAALATIATVEPVDKRADKLAVAHDHILDRPPTVREAGPP